MNQITVEEFLKKRDRFFLLDVRTKKEFKEGHLKEAKSIPLQELPERINELPKKNIVVYCRSGARSAHAVDILTNNNINALNLQGGTIRCKELGVKLA